MKKKTWSRSATSRKGHTSFRGKQVDFFFVYFFSPTDPSITYYILAVRHWLKTHALLAIAHSRTMEWMKNTNERGARIKNGMYDACY